MLSTAWLKEPHVRPQKSKKWLDVKSQARRDVALFKKEVSPRGEGPKPIPTPTKLFKFQALSEAYAMKLYPAPIFAIVMTTDEKIMQVIVRPM